MPQMLPAFYQSVKASKKKKPRKSLGNNNLGDLSKEKLGVIREGED